MTHNFFLNLASVFFPAVCLILSIAPGEMNNLIAAIMRWFHIRFNVPQDERNTLQLNETALRIFGIIGLIFSLFIITLILRKTGT